MPTITPRKTRSAGPAEDIDLDHPAGGAEADSHMMGVHPPTRLEREVSAVLLLSWQEWGDKLMDIS
jgi:hypothetical protein